MESSKKAPAPNIMNVREIIEFAFGDFQRNAVNFKLVQTVLYLIARQLRLLERRVQIELGPLTLLTSASKLSVTEVKVHAMQTKTKKTKGAGAGGKKTGRTEQSSDKTSSSAKGGKPHEFPDILNTLEEQREKELRIIHQRADSFEEATKSPTPMASVSSMQAQNEKLLVVKQVPSKQASQENLDGQTRTPEISVVTQEQFEQLANAIEQLEKRLLPVGTAEFPENAELMSELRRGASLTDAMAALQLSARLEATEKVLAQMISMVAELAMQTGLELDSEAQALLLGAGAPDSTLKQTNVKGTTGRTRTKRAKGGKSVITTDTSDIETILPTSETIDSTDITETPYPQPSGAPLESESAIKRDYVTNIDLRVASQEMYDEMLKNFKSVTQRTTTTAENAYKLAAILETKLESALTATARMVDLENAVKQYTDQINALDTGLSSQMTNYQEQLTQMQHDLEVGLDTMAEVLGNTGGDAMAVAELHSNFTNLQLDLESMSFLQKELQDAQHSTAYDLETLWKEIEMLRDTKSDREEVADALRDKAGIGELNGLVSLQQFEAVRSDYEKRIHAAYDKFNNQESIWQKAIDDIFKIFNDKADLIQVQSLKDEILKYLNRIKDRIQIISEIVGEPKSAMLARKVFRDAACLSCGSPAHMDMEEPCKVLALPKFHSSREPAQETTEESQTKGGGDHGICYPDLPIPHPRDPRSHICKRYCGGSHTVVTEGTVGRAPPGLVVRQEIKPSTTSPGTDGKMYLVDEQPKKIPCLACNMLKPTPDAPEPETIKQAPKESIDLFGSLSLTPPAHEMSYKSYN